jgi:hypothetical protein
LNNPFRNRKKVEQEKREQEKKLLKEKFKNLFLCPEGEEILNAIKKRGLYGKSVFHQDAQTNAYNQGVQALAIWITEQVEK